MRDFEWVGRYWVLGAAPASILAETLFQTSLGFAVSPLPALASAVLLVADLFMSPTAAAPATLAPVTAKALTRRPLKSRQARWIRALASWLAQHRVHPNIISVASVVAAALAATCLLAVHATPRAIQVVLMMAAIGFILLRLLANVVDGLVAVEGGLKSPTGDLYNEVPDRLSDVVLLAGAGYAIPGLGWAVALGWAAALLAIVTAYVRLLGGALGLSQNFSGPMAKAHRMATLCVGCAGSIVEVLVIGFKGWSLAGALVVIAVGSIVTAIRRLATIRRDLMAR
jgi:phosphatidylglycerophosphate synthase